MARKQVGQLDAELLALVDEKADELGQTRVTFITRALEQALGVSQRYVANRAARVANVEFAHREAARRQPARRVPVDPFQKGK